MTVRLMTAIDTVRREMWESYQAHLGEGCIDRRLLLRWYGMLEGPAPVLVKDRDGCGETWTTVAGYKVVLTPDDGQIAVRVPFFPGLFTWGATEEEALAAAREAIALALDECPDETPLER